MTNPAKRLKRKSSELLAPTTMPAAYPSPPTSDPTHEPNGTGQGESFESALTPRAKKRKEKKLEKRKPQFKFNPQNIRADRKIGIAVSCPGKGVTNANGAVACKGPDIVHGGRCQGSRLDSRRGELLRFSLMQELMNAAQIADPPCRRASHPWTTPRTPWNTAYTGINHTTSLHLPLCLPFGGTASD